MAETLPYAVYNFGTFFSGQTFDAVPFTAARTPTSLANLASVRMQFRLQNAESCCVALELSTANGGVTITNSATWAFTVNKIQELELEAGFYVYSTEFIDANGDEKHYLMGSLVVIQPPTR